MTSVSPPATARGLALGAAPPSAVASSIDRSGRGWSYALAMAGYPLAWAVGLAPVFHLALAVPMALWLIRHRPLQVPRGTILFGLFLVIVAASVIQVDSAGRLAVYALRASWYVAALVMFLYVVRQRRPEAAAVMVGGLVALWAMAVAGGLASLMAPEADWSTPVARLLPEIIAGNDFIEQLITPHLAEVQVIRRPDVTLYRPAAPFAYTNAWGSTVALLTPFAIAAAHDRRIGLPRPVLAVGLVVAAVPFAMALNRGAWLTLAVGLVYGLVRWSLVTRNSTSIRLLVVAAALGLVLATASGLVTTARHQLDTRSADSDERRTVLYVETIEAAARSPLIGYGTTRPNPADPGGPPLGTHGQLWAVLFAHGYVAAALYVAFFASAFLRARPVDPIGHWAKVSLLIGLVQLPIYGHLPQQLFILVGCAALVGRARPTTGGGER